MRAARTCLQGPRSPWCLPYHWAGACVSFGLQSDAVFDFGALDIEVRAEIILAAGLAHHTNALLLDDLACLQEPGVERFHFLHVEGEFAMEISPPGEVEPDQTPASQHSQGGFDLLW